MHAPAGAGLAAARVSWSLMAVAVAVVLLTLAAWHDVRTRLIPDAIPLCLSLLGVAYRAQFGMIELGFSVFAALLLFFLLFFAFNRGIVGGGDVKLMVAMALWLSPADCYVFLVVTALVGGGLAVLHLVMRAILAGPRYPLADLPPAAAWWRVELARMQAGAPLPYAVAIAGGGYYVLLISIGG